MTAMAMNAPFSEIDEEPPPFAIDDKAKEIPALQNLSFASSAAQPPIGHPAGLHENSSQQQGLSTAMGLDNGIQQTFAAVPPPANTLLTTSSSDATKLVTTEAMKHSSQSLLPEGSSSSLSQNDAHSITTSSTSSMNSSGSNASSGSENLPLLTQASPPREERRMHASSTIMASSLFTVPLNSDSTMSLQSSQHTRSNAINGSRSFGNSTSRMRFSQLMQSADDSNLPAVPENEAVESFEMFGDAEREVDPLILPAAHQIPDYSPRSAAAEAEIANSENDLWFFNLLSAARRSSQPRRQQNHQITILDASSSRLNAPLLSSSVQQHQPFGPSIDHARARVQAWIEDHDTFEVSTKFPTGNDSPQAYTVEDIMNILTNPTNLQTWYDPVETVVVISRSNSESGLEGSGGSNESDRQYEGEWIEASTTALQGPTCVVGPMYELENSFLATIGMGNYGKVTIFAEHSHGRVTLTVGPFPGGIHLRHTIRVIEEDGAVRLVDRVRLETETTDSSSFQNIVSLRGMLNSCILPPLAAYMEQVKNSMARLLMLVESGQVSSNGSSGGGSGLGATMLPM